MSELIIRKPGEGPQYSITGDLYRFLLSGDESGGRFTIWHATVPPGGGPPPHIHHRENEAFYVLKGELTFYALDVDQVVKAGPGTFVHLPPDRPHRFANEGDQEVETLIMAIPAGIEKMFMEVGTPSDKALPLGPEEVQKLLQAAPDYGIDIL